MASLKVKFSLVFGLFLMVLAACSDEPKKPFPVEELTPWCILEFDTLDRTPEQRISMLKEMGFKQYGYNWRVRHLDQMQEEFALAKANDINITSIFLWLNAKRDTIGKLSPRNQKMLENLSKVEYKPTIWVSFSNNYFENIDQESSFALSLEMIQYVKSIADELGCKLALYNHSGWFGNPHNQVEILERLNDESITMVYNFHHAHEVIDEFPLVVQKIRPFLSHVNINGMEKDGEKILPIGNGDHEFEMIQTLQNAGYDGPWGVLGHVKSEDVQVVLERNLKGLNQL